MPFEMRIAQTSNYARSFEALLTQSNVLSVV